MEKITNKITLSAEELLELPNTKELLNNYGDSYSIEQKIKLDLAKTENYKPAVFYHATGGLGEIGLGKGLYLGKDKKALENFYNCDGTCGKIEEYHGNPKFIDLTIYEEFNEFEKLAIAKYGNSTKNEHLKLLTLDMGFDGIRYYDPLATGEEFVLYNTKKVIKI
ncbi:MAG: hypothetical protein KAW87_01250 [Candidatus Cloacimonetes bacterium]|nr:hypothetical protein [Candidatus Cloacimonadota bacterium]